LLSNQSYFYGWLGLISSGAWRQGAGTVSKRICRDERRSRPERSFATLGQNERPREKQSKTGPVKWSKEQYAQEDCKCHRWA